MSLFSSHKNKTQRTASGIRIEDVRPDKQEFRRIYTAQLDDRADIEVEARTWMGRSYDGTLTQPNGNRVYFDPQRIADKILDPLLVPLVQRAVDEIIGLDKEYVDSKPASFTDKSDITWVRQP